MNNEKPFEDTIVHQALARKSIQEHLSMHANKTKHKEKFFDNPHPFHTFSHNIANRKVKSPNPNPYCMHKLQATTRFSHLAPKKLQLKYPNPQIY